ncbi:unnamed protein product [Paramecium octaurelia]|uniref:SAM-dependent MTase RsmB/NOP-type domain-containing protein n=1 Tax=Paramecium octaurelia TaxID=43137 RepID=A0A8S1U8A7_PAROT|nr:unnamed protein product [Paramecium octaurelia]
MSNKKPQFSKKTLQLAQKYAKQLSQKDVIELKSDDDNDIKSDDEELNIKDDQNEQNSGQQEDEQFEEQQGEDEENNVDEEDENDEDQDDEQNEEDDEQNGDQEEENQDEQEIVEQKEEPKKQKKIKIQQQVEEEQEQEDEQNELESYQEEEQQNDQLFETDLNAIMNRINKIIEILKQKEYGKFSREELLNELKKHLCTYYGYNSDLMSHFTSMFKPAELVAFLDANDAPRPITIRVNTLRTRRKELAQTLVQRGVNLDSVGDWTKVGLVIYESKVPIGATPEYLSGHYMLQSASSFLPVLALAPQMNERILDMAAAPGGKTTYIAQLMKNSGVIFANDTSKDREKALFYNLQRMGVTNCIVTNYDGRKFPKVMKNFDRVLLDAPCTGLGIISKDPSIKAQKQMRDILKHSHLQKELILSAIDCCKKGGIIVYSTCSVSVHENEVVLQYALNNRHVKLIDTGLEVGNPGLLKFDDKKFHPSMNLARRIYPHVHNMDGFFYAKLKKINHGPIKEEVKSEVQKPVVMTKKMKKKEKQMEKLRLGEARKQQQQQQQQ